MLKLLLDHLINLQLTDSTYSLTSVWVQIQTDGGEDESCL